MVDMGFWAPHLDTNYNSNEVYVSLIYVWNEVFILFSECNLCGLLV